MTKRQLTEEEVALTEKSMQRLEREMAFVSYKLKLLDLDLQEGLKLKFEMAKKDAEKQKSEAFNALELANAQLKIAREQILEGVEMIEGENNG